MATTKRKIAGHKGRLRGEMHNIDAILRAIDILGGTRSDLANALNVSWQQVTLWLNGDSIVTGERAVVIEEITKGEVTREEIRPDLYRSIKVNSDEMEEGQ